MVGIDGATIRCTLLMKHIATGVPVRSARVANLLLHMNSAMVRDENRRARTDDHRGGFDDFTSSEG